MNAGSRRERLLTRALLGPLLALIAAGYSCSTTPPRPNVILIIVDALRPDYLGCYGFERPTSPNIDALARAGVIFDSAIAHAPWTKPSFSSILTSTYPFQHGVVDWEAALPDTFLTLPEVLRAAGYSTMAVTNTPGLTGEFKVTRGIATVSGVADRGRDAAATTDEALTLIRGARRPFFILIHYLDTHVPYRPSPGAVASITRPGDPDPFAAVVGEEDGFELNSHHAYVDRQRLLYAGCIRQVDEGIGRIVAALGEKSIRQETLIMITADHGEGFMEHGALSHGNNLYDEAIKVPLVVNYPDRLDRARSVDAQVRHIDVLPTIVDFTGVDDPGHREGTSLRALMTEGKRRSTAGKFLPPDVALSETDFRKTPDTKCLRTSACKIIVEPATSLLYLYDLKADPGETVNLWGRDVPAADSLRRLIEKVPGHSVSGWRLALVGARRGTAVEVNITPAEGGRIAGVRRIAGRGAKLTIDLKSDGSSLDIGGAFGDLRLAEFVTEPEQAQLTLTVVARGDSGPPEVRVGATGTAPLGQAVVVDPQRGLGLPGDFPELRAGSAPAICLWWLPGEPLREGGARGTLTPEDRRRLRALGYVQ